MLLSIGMIVKNEEKRLRECLTAISPLLKEVEAELVIVDTGSTDATVEIAKEFTSKVFFYEWTNDFGAARNISLDKSKGEWFLFIDADEIAKDIRGLIEFFKSGDYKNYNGATICIRNYLDKDGKVYSDFNVPRLIRKKKDIYFEGSVHEHFTKDPLPIKVLKAVFGHDGYYYETEQERTEKCERNRLLLQNEITKRPGVGLPYLQMMEVYEIEERYEEALEYYEKGIEAARKEGKQDLVLNFYANGIMCYQRLERPWEALKLVERYFADKKRERTLDLEIYAMKGLAYLSANEPAAAADAFRKYSELYFSYKENPTLTNEMAYHSLQFVSEASFLEIALHATEANRRRKDFSEAKRWLELFPNTYTTGLAGYLARFKIEVEVMAHFGDYSRLSYLYETAEGDFLKWFFKGIELYVFDNDVHRIPALKELSGMKKTDTAFLNIVRAYMDNDAGVQIGEKRLEKLISENTPLEGLSLDLLHICLKEHLTLNRVAKSISPYDLKTCIKKLGAKYTDFGAIAFEYISAVETTDEKELLWIGGLAYSILTEIKTFSENEKLFLLSVFAECTNNYMNAVLRPEMLTEEWIATLPQVFSAAFYCYQAIIAVERGQNKLAEKNMELALKVDPSLGDSIQVFRNQILDNEMAKYAEKIKKSIKDFIIRGELENAKQVIAAYEQINSGDAEIEEIKKRLQ